MSFESITSTSVQIYYFAFFVFACKFFSFCANFLLDWNWSVQVWEAMTIKKSKKVLVDLLTTPKCKNWLRPRSRGDFVCLQPVKNCSFKPFTNVFTRGTFKLRGPSKIPGPVPKVPPGPLFQRPWITVLLLIELNLTVSSTVRFLFEPFEIYYKFITDCALILFQFNIKKITFWFVTFCDFIYVIFTSVAYIVAAE